MDPDNFAPKPVSKIPDPDPPWIWPIIEKCHSFQSWFKIVNRRSYKNRKLSYHIIFDKKKFTLRKFKYDLQMILVDFLLF